MMLQCSFFYCHIPLHCRILFGQTQFMVLTAIVSSLKIIAGSGAYTVSPAADVHFHVIGSALGAVIVIAVSSQRKVGAKSSMQESKQSQSKGQLRTT